MRIGAYEDASPVRSHGKHKENMTQLDLREGCAVNYPETSIEPIIPEKMGWEVGGGGGGGFRANTKMLEQFVKPATLLCRGKLPPYQPFFFFSGNIITLFKE